MVKTTSHTAIAKQLPMLCLLVFVTLVSFTARAQDKWLGFYESTSDKILLQVEPKDAEGNFRGRLLFQDLIIPIKAFTLLGVMTGEFQRDGVDKLFSLYRVGDVWTFSIDNQDYSLKKVAKAEFPEQTAVTARPQPKVVTATAISGTTVKDSGGTFTFVVPEGWKVRLEDDAQVLTKTGEVAELRIAAHHYSDRQKMLREGNGEEFEDIFNFLSITSKSYGTHHVHMTSRGKLKGSQVVIESLLLFSPHGGGAMLSATINDKNRASEYFSLLEQMAQTVVFEKPVEDNTWLNRVRGKQLLYLKSISGGSTKYYYNLYSNGRYDYVYTYTYNSSGFYGADNDRDDGTWKIINRGNKAVLILNGTRKGTQEIVLEKGSASNELTGNGERFFLKTIE